MPKLKSSQPQPSEPPQGYKVEDACAFLRISKPSVYRLIDRGLLRPNRALRHLIFSREELLRFLRDNTA
jgi:excisionase family DNA binding protein